MDKEEIRKVVLNMISHRKRDDAELQISEIEEWDNSFADDTADVVISGVSYGIKLTNTRWHDGHGYDLEFNSSGGSGKDREEEIVVEKNNTRTYLHIFFS